MALYEVIVEEVHRYNVMSWGNTQEEIEENALHMHMKTRSTATSETPEPRVVNIKPYDSKRSNEAP